MTFGWDGEQCGHEAHIYVGTCKRKNRTRVSTGETTHKVREGERERENNSSDHFNCCRNANPTCTHIYEEPSRLIFKSTVINSHLHIINVCYGIAKASSCEKLPKNLEKQPTITAHSTQNKMTTTLTIYHAMPII